MKPIFKLISKYDADVRTEVIGKGKYRVIFTSGNIRLFKLISKEEYTTYRNTFYLSPGKAKNRLLDKLSFENTPFCREDFNYVDLRKLSPDAERALREFIDTLDRDPD